MLADFITSAIATLLVVADPVLLSALFLGITHGMTKAHRREVVRLSFGHEQTVAELEEAADRIAKVILKLRGGAP